MIVAGFVNFALDALLDQEAADLTFTFGQALDLLPPVLFLHVFLAYPSGRLGSPFALSLVAVAYVTAIGLGVVRMLLGGFGPR